MASPEPTAPALVAEINPTQSQRPVQAVLWMAFSGILFVLVTALVKHMDGRLPAAQSAFLRYFLGLAFLIPVVPKLFRLRLPGRVWGLFGLRGFCHSLAVILWFFAMANITIAEVTAMNYLTPVYVTLGAALFLGERLQVRRILAVAAALVGALVILRPGLRPLEAGHLAMMGTALLFSVSYLSAKRLTDLAPPMIIVTILSFTVTLGILPFAVAVWVPPSLPDLGILFVIAALATLGHYTMTLALRAGPLSVTQPVTFLQLVWAVALGALIFGEPVDAWVVFGGVTILASVSFIAIREAQLRREARLSR